MMEPSRELVSVVVALAAVGSPDKTSCPQVSPCPAEKITIVGGGSGGDDDDDDDATRE